MKSFYDHKNILDSVTLLLVKLRNEGIAKTIVINAKNPNLKAIK